MIKSMTGYGRAEYADEDLKIAVEIKSVNNRYLDIGIKMPRQLGMLEAGIRAELKKYISRGKVDVYITYEDLKEANMQVKYNSKIAGEYLKYLRQMAQEYGLDNDIRVSTLSKYPDVLTMEEEPMDPVQLWDRLRAVVDEAAENFREARVREGEFLRNDLIGKLNEMQGHVDFITERSPQIVAAYRQRLCDKVKELIGDAVIDDSRIVQEVTIYADKVCVDEELVRLQSHIKATREALDGSEGIGRKLDFIAQEMNRESNTILSKSDNLEVSDRAIELKTTVEKVREQIQNIFGNTVNAGKIIAIVSPDSAPVKRLVSKAREDGRTVDATQGRKTKAVLIMENDRIILSALLPETIRGRAQGTREDMSREEEERPD